MKFDEIIKLSNAVLKNYRSIPFWSWNDKLEKHELIRQIDWMKDNGIGGFFMHARSGLKTEYLSEEWMECVDICEQHAEKVGMDAWLYDENGWPSGFAGGKLLEDMENRDRYLTNTVGAYDKDALVSYLIINDKLNRTTEPGKGEYLNIFEHYSASTADVLNPEVVGKFISLTHEEYKTRYGEDFSRKIKGFFTDEPQYYRWNMPYTKMIRNYFSEVLNEDILDGIGLLFMKKDGYREFRYKYWKGMQTLFLNGFSKPVYDWCDQNGVMLTGHYIEESSLGGQMLCCAGVMPAYEYEHIPGIDWLGRYCDNQLAPRQIVSVAKQLGKDRVLSEIYACGGWNNSPFQMKIMTEYLYMNGINLICQHLLPYSEKGNRVHDHPSHFYEGNPWVQQYFKEYNDYFTKLGAVLSAQEETVQIAVLHPIRSAYFDYNQETEKNYFDIGELDNKLKEVIDRLAENGLSYHFIDENLLAKYGKADNGVISCGKCDYNYLILPCNITMDISTEKMLRRYSETGGKILICNGKPEYLEWKPYNYDYLESNITFEELVDSRPFNFTSKGGNPFVSLRSDLYFVINHSEEELSQLSFDFGGKYSSFECVNIETDEISIIPLSFTLEPGESAVLMPSKETVKPEEPFERVRPLGEYTVVSSDDNSLVLDVISYSFDGEKYSEPMCVPIAFQYLLKERFEGILHIRYNTNVIVLPEAAYFTTKMSQITGISVNGTMLSVSDENNIRYDITNLLKLGENTIELKMNYYQKQQVYDVIFGENITESLKNCLVYDSEFEPLIITGNFGVCETSGYINGKRQAAFYGKSFAITEKQEKLKGLISGGYPFFAGKIKLSSTFTVTSQHVLIEIPGRWHTAVLTVNGVYAGTALLTRSLNISEFVHMGENTLEAELTIGNRNLLGPHHYVLDEDPLSQSPLNFEFPDYYDPEKEQAFTPNMILIEPLG